jgi:hypothetical protein
MATVTVILDESKKKAESTLKEIAEDQDWTLAESGTTPGNLHLVKGSWDASIIVHLESISRGETRLSFVTNEAWAITDWGHGRPQVEKLLEAMGAEKD